MKRLMTLLLALTLSAVLFSTVQPAAASWAGIEYFYNFSDSLKPFRVYSDHSTPSNMDIVALTLSHDCYVGDLLGGVEGVDNSCALLTNNHSARIVTLMAPLTGHGIMINVDFIARDLGGCERCAPVVYVGSGKPEGIGSFQMVGPPLTTGWTASSYRAFLASPDPVIALGIVNLDDGKGLQHAGIDNVRVKFLDD
jgi:hypothetical protein